MRLGIGAIGLVAPGLASWTEGRQQLLDNAAYDLSAELPPLKPTLLPPNERRRTTPLIRLAMQASQHALEQWAGDSSELGTVFASASGDVDIVDKIISSLLMPGSPVSPTHFHNSVHNAPAGYWSIATHSHAPSTSISAYDASFAAGLLEAATEVVVEQRPVMLAAYDMPLPPRMHPFRPLRTSFATTLILLPEHAQGLQAHIEITLRNESSGEDTMLNDGLERLRLDCPSARSLPLLASLARGVQENVCIAGVPGQMLEIEVTPC
jgi:hypothetical protein